MAVAVGRLVAIHRWPVKSLGGERVPAARLDGRGLGGDRTQALLADGPDGGRRLTARQLPAMLSWHAAYPSAPAAALDPADPPPPVLTAPDGRAWRWHDPGLPAALAADLGRPLRLHRDPAGHQDRPRTVLVTLEVTRAALESELAPPGPAAPVALDVRRFRPNLHLDLDVPAFAEEAWEGGRLVIGGRVELELLDPCVRCVVPTRDPDTTRRWPELLRHLTARHGQRFGINARVVAGGVVEEGATAVVVPA
jgi:uncharacterized protein YcbX